MPPIKTVDSDHLNPGTIHKGIITETGKKKSTASIGAQAVGTLFGVALGSTIGSGGGKAGAMVAGGILGNVAANHFDPKKVEELTIQLDKGQTLIVDVQGNPFREGDRVKVSMSGGSVNSVVRDAE